MPRFIPVNHDPFADFRRSENIEDRRKEHFNSFPQAPQKPNVFSDGLMIGLDRDADFASILPKNQLSDDAGAQILDDRIQRYLAERAPGKSPKLIPVDHDPFGDR